LIFAKVVQSKNPLRKFFENVFRDLRFGGNFRKETVFKKSERDSVFLLFQKLFQMVFALNDFLKIKSRSKQKRKGKLFHF